MANRALAGVPAERTMVVGGVECCEWCVTAEVSTRYFAGDLMTSVWAPNKGEAKKMGKEKLQKALQPILQFMQHVDAERQVDKEKRLADESGDAAPGAVTPEEAQPSGCCHECFEARPCSCDGGR